MILKFNIAKILNILMPFQYCNKVCILLILLVAKNCPGNKEYIIGNVFVYSSVYFLHVYTCISYRNCQLFFPSESTTPVYIRYIYHATSSSESIKTCSLHNTKTQIYSFLPSLASIYNTYNFNNCQYKSFY